MFLPTVRNTTLRLATWSARRRRIATSMPACPKKAGDASLFLAHVADAEEPWLAKLDELDLLAPCISLIWSRAGIDALATHLQQFLIADIGDGMGVMLRYFDPRNLKTTMTLWGEDTTQKLMAPSCNGNIAGMSRSGSAWTAP